MLVELVKELDSKNLKKVEETLLELVKKTKSKEDVQRLFILDTFPRLFNLLSYESLRVPALSILANCANLDDNWRETFYKEDGILKLVDILGMVTESTVVSRVARLLANLSRNPFCLNSIQTNFIISSLIKHAASTEHVKCQTSCLRALRMICNSKQASKLAADCEEFPKLLMLLNSPDPDIMLLCLRLICELLKAQTVEIGYRLVEESVRNKLLELSNHSSEDIRDLIMETLFLLSLHSGCRVAVSMEGGIEMFMNRIRDFENTKSFKYAVQSLCLCAREAVSRNKMKLCGALPLMVSVLQREEFETFHESLVAAFVWFLFDDSSLGLLIRADVTPSLLHYLDRLTSVECESRQEFDVNEHDTFFNTAVSSEIDLQLTQPLSPPHQQRAQSPQWLYSTPETSPYHANSPQYSIPAYSPHRSPNYSPPSSPQNLDSLSPEYDGYCDSLNESCGSSSKNVPYHFQSADGIHAMIHGTRGPIHDTLLLLSRFSQAKNPSSFFLYLPGFNSLLNYLTLSHKPNPKCARVLNRITLNSQCFDILLRKKLIPRLYLRLCTGWSLEHLTYLLITAKKGLEANDGVSENMSKEEPVHNTYRCKRPLSTFTNNLGQLLMSNIRSQCESAYGKGVISNILLAGSKELREVCLVSLPHIIWSVRLQHRLFSKLRAQNMLLEMLTSSLEKDEESFILIVEAICALCRFIGLNVHLECGTGAVLVSREVKVVDDSFESPRKKQKLEPGLPVESSSCRKDTVTLKLASQKIIRCRKTVLTTHSVVFEKMLSQEFIESKGPFVPILDVEEEAFTVMLHFLSGCTVRLDHYFSCKENCPLSVVKVNTKNTLGHKENPPEQIVKSEFENQETEKAAVHTNEALDSTIAPAGKFNVQTEGDQSETEENPELPSKQLEERGNWKFAFDLLSCSERFFIDELKKHCEQYLLGEITAENVVDMYMLSTWHGSKLLAQTTLVYLLTMVNCPKLRTKYFMEILRSHEKEVFLSQIQKMIFEYFNREIT